MSKRTNLKPFGWTKVTHTTPPSVPQHITEHAYHVPGMPPEEQKIMALNRQLVEMMQANAPQEQIVLVRRELDRLVEVQRARKRAADRAARAQAERDDFMNFGI